MIFGSFFRQRKRAAAVDDEKPSHLHITKPIPTPVPYSDVYSFGRDHVTEVRSRVLSANNAIIYIVTPTQASPTSLGTIGPRSLTSSLAEDEYESSYHVWPQPFPFGQNRSHTAGEVPNLTGQVVIAASRPVFEGTYSSVYRGTYINLEVCAIYPRFYILTIYQVAIKAIRAVKHATAMRRVRVVDCPSNSNLIFILEGQEGA